MDQVVGVYLYSPNVLLIWGLLLFFCISLWASPQLFASMVIALALLRPNERFEHFISFPKVSFVLLILSLIIYSKEFRDYRFKKDDKVIFSLILLVILQTIIFYRENFIPNLEFCGINLLRFLVAIVLLSNRKGLKTLNYTLLFSCFLICFEPLYFHFTESPGSKLWNYFHGSNFRLIAWGMWANANETSFLACFGVANMVMLLFQKDKNPILTPFSFFLLPFFAVVIYLSASRAGFVSLLLFFSGIILTIRSTNVKILSTLLVIILIVVAPYLTTKRTDETASSNQRSELRQDGIYLFKQEPIRGYGFMRIINETGGMMLHNTYLQAFAELGVVGGALLLFYLYLLGKPMLIYIRKARDQLPENIIIVSFGIYISGLFYFMWGNQLFTIFFFTFATIIKVTQQSSEIPEVEKIEVTEHQAYLNKARQDPTW